MMQNQEEESESNEDDIEAHNKRHQGIFDDDDEDVEAAS
jgi:hypothetical protein